MVFASASGSDLPSNYLGSMLGWLLLEDMGLFAS